MAPKKTPFIAFLDCHKNNDITNGNKPCSRHELKIKLTPVWKTMTEKEKTKYRILALEYNSTLVPEQPNKQISDLQNNTYNFWNMQKYLTNMFECIPNYQELLNKKFILLHINCHTHNGEQYYFPAEIAALEFNLKNGISRTYHQIIGLSKIYPRGFAGEMRQYSDQFHQIYCWDEHPDDYQKIFLEFLTFLKDGIINHTDLQEGTLDLPYLYTIESEFTSNMMTIKSSLDKLYFTAFPKVDAERCKSTFKIGSIQHLFSEIIKKMNLYLNCQNVQIEMSVDSILKLDMYGCGLGCKYHELRDISQKCSKARIIQWMSNICKHIHRYTGLHLKPGRHSAIHLRDGSKIIIENEHLPLTMEVLKLNCETTSIDGSLHNSTSNIKPSTLTQTQLDSQSNNGENDH